MKPLQKQLLLPLLLFANTLIMTWRRMTAAASRNQNRYQVDTQGSCNCHPCQRGRGSFESCSCCCKGTERLNVTLQKSALIYLSMICPSMSVTAVGLRSCVGIKLGLGRPKAVNGLTSQLLSLLCVTVRSTDVTWGSHARPGFRHSETQPQGGGKSRARAWTSPSSLRRRPSTAVCEFV